MASSNGDTVATAEYDVNFPKFEVVDGYPNDHHFYQNGGRRKYDPSSAASKKIMQEWKILEQNLPNSIFVRVYEKKINLLRAAIVGVAGTPYQDGLFFFDIAFPTNYPYSPPLVQYRSFGYRINPNLYESGYVCLSLINTWHGSNEEKWDPNRSTILQVLLSIQGLVLHTKPYFNEPALSLLKNLSFMAKNSEAYNETVFVLCCKTAICLLRSPPQHFHSLVCRHFRCRAVSILTACNAYKNGHAVVGYGIGVNGKVSTLLKKDMKLVYGILVAELEKNDGSLRNLLKQLEEEADARAKTDAAPRKERNFGLVRVFQKLKEFFC